VNRTISVHSSALLEALDHVYSAKRIVTELKSPTTAATTPGSK